MPYVTRERDTQGIEGPVGSSLYGVCHTDSDVALKIVDLSDFDKLIPGVTIHVKFAHTNTAIDPLMDVNGTGILPLVSYGDYRPGLTPASSWNDDSIITLTYDGNAWVINGYSNADSQFIVDSELSDTSVNPVQNRVIKQALDTFAGVLHYRGTKPTVASLPQSGNIQGDVWLVEENDSEYIWNGATWEQFGPTIDLSGYATKTYVDTADSDIIKYFGVPYGVCSTGAGSAAKTVSPSAGSFTLQEGARIVVRFANPNSAASPTLNVSGTGAKAIYYKGERLGDSVSERAMLTGAIEFVYDGTNYNVVGTFLNTQTVTGVKGDAESSYRTGDVNITKANIGLGNVDNTADANKNVKTAKYRAPMVLGSNFDLNLLSDQSTYQSEVYNGASALNCNFPIEVASHKFVITVTRSAFTSGTSEQLQMIAYDVTDQKLYIRSYDMETSTWGSWHDITLDLNVKSIATSADLNDLTETGNYFSYAHSSNKNFPSTLTANHMALISVLSYYYNGNYISQTIVDLRTGDTYVRGCTANFGWTSWMPSTLSGSSPISVSGKGVVSHNDSGATEGSYGDSAAQTPTYGAKFKVPYITIDAKGHVTGISEHTVQIPAAIDISNKVDKVSGKGLSTEDYTTAEKNKLSGIESGAQVNTVTGVKGNSESSYRTGDINITKANIGLSNVDNTSDANKPVSTAQQAALDLKAPLDSPMFIGNPCVPGPDSQSGGLTIVNKSYVDKILYEYDPSSTITNPFTKEEALFVAINNAESSNRPIIIKTIERITIPNYRADDYTLHLMLSSSTHRYLTAEIYEDRYHLVGDLGYINNQFYQVFMDVYRQGNPSTYTWTYYVGSIYTFVPCPDDWRIKLNTGTIAAGETTVTVRYRGTYIASSVRVGSSSSGYTSGELVMTDILLSGDQTSPFAVFTIDAAADTNLLVTVISV